MDIKLTELFELAKDCKLLYVEDNEDARYSTLHLLNRFFQDITVGVDGEDGFEKFSKNDFDLIITDINMPKLNGIEMISKIRDSGSDILTIILSAHNETEYYEKANNLNISYYLTKPVKLPCLIEALFSVLSLMEVA